MRLLEGELSGPLHLLLCRSEDGECELAAFGVFTVRPCESFCFSGSILRHPRALIAAAYGCEPIMRWSDLVHQVGRLQLPQQRRSADGDSTSSVLACELSPSFHHIKVVSWDPSGGQEGAGGTVYWEVATRQVSVFSAEISRISRSSFRLQLMLAALQSAVAACGRHLQEVDNAMEVQLGALAKLMSDHATDDNGTPITELLTLLMTGAARCAAPPGYLKAQPSKTSRAQLTRLTATPCTTGCQ